MRSVQIYIEGERDSNDYTEIELFNDEKIDINLSIQNIQDISKVFTDFSQSFTIPASSINNSIFKHFYENAVDLDTTLIDQRLRRNAFIEIDRTPFRSGKIQLEKANLKDGQAESYTITFYGDLVTLKDLFGEDKLSDLDYSNVTNPYSYSDVKARITDGATDYDVRYPLISSSRLWNYGGSSSTDISSSGGAIDYTELFPAVKVAKIFELIESRYSLDFTGLFLTDERFTKLFLWYKNSVNSTDTLQNQLLNFTGTISDAFYAPSSEFLLYSETGSSSKVYLDFTSVGITSLFPKIGELGITVYPSSDLTATYYLEVYKNDVLNQTFTGVGNQVFVIFNNTISNDKNSYSFRVRSSVSISDVYCDFSFTLKAAGGTLLANGGFSYDGFSLSTNIDLGMTAPNIKVADFFSGILKQFNLTCYPTNSTTFEIEPLDYWYQKGAVTDITDFVDVATIDIAKVPLYKRISFEYAESKSFLNDEFYGDNRRYYGNLSNGYNFDGGDYIVKVPFENLLFNKFSGSVQVGYSLTAAPDYKGYIPNPILLYMYPQQTVATYRLTDSATNNESLTENVPFGQDLLTNGYNYSLNFGQDISTLLNASVPNSISQIYYNGYLSNLFNYKNRLTSLKAIFPTSLITSLELNDRLIIRDKRYIINNIKTDLTTGEVDLELINDFREISNENIIILGESSGVVEIPILVPNGVNDVNVTTASTGVTLGATTNFTSDGILEVNYSANPDPLFNRVTESGDTRITEQIYTRRSEAGTNFVIQLDLENTYINGDVTNTQIYLIQEA